MIYAKDHFNLHPASPATRDRFVATATDALLPAGEPHGARPLGAWLCSLKFTLCSIRSGISRYWALTR